MLHLRFVWYVGSIDLKAVVVLLVLDLTLGFERTRLRVATVVVEYARVPCSRVCRVVVRVSVCRSLPLVWLVVCVVVCRVAIRARMLVLVVVSRWPARPRWDTSLVSCLPEADNRANSRLEWAASIVPLPRSLEVAVIVIVLEAAVVLIWICRMMPTTSSARVISVRMVIVTR